MPVRTSSRAKYRAKNRKNEPAPATPEALLARQDLGAFGAYVVNKVPAAHHSSWFPYLVTGESSSELNEIAGGNLSILAPRGSAKSTWLALYAAFAIGLNPHIQIIYVGYSESVALKQSRMIKRIVASKQYQQVFPSIRPGQRWSDRDWEIDKEYAGVTSLDSDYTFYAVGCQGAITSRRSSLIICDDLIKSSAAIANPDTREKMLCNYSEVLEPTLIPGGRVVSIGTRFRPDDIHATEFIGSNGWEVVQQSAIEVDERGNERSYWAARFGLESLQKIRDRKPLIFCFQYQNKLPDNSENAIIRPEWIVYDECPTTFDELVLGVDLAASEKTRADYTAMVLVGRKGDLFYVVEVLEFRAVGNVEKIKRICELRKKWGNFKVIVEKVAYQSSFEGDWKVEMTRRRLSGFGCEMVTPKGDKDSRLEGISGVFSNNIVRFSRTAKCGRLVSQLLRLDLEHDDLSDGCEMAIARLQRRSRRPLTTA
jgi:phage terminase large subunit-like protein